MRMVLGLYVAVCLTLISGVIVAQAPPSSVNDGVYTAEQAKRGATLYLDACAACHLESLSGRDAVPGLTRETLVAKFANLGELFTKVKVSMPAFDPGSLKPEEVAEVLAYVLEQNKYPAGQVELPITTATLEHVKLEPLR
jgi:S-disulfanyl-L-cysteine oxidoreductase SoxD